MAVAFDGTRVANADDATDPISGDWTDTGGGAASEEMDFVFQRSAGTNGSISEKLSKDTELGVGWVADAGIDMTTPKVILLKCLLATPSVLYTTVGQGAIVEIGSGGRRNAWHEYWVAYGLGTDPEYPPTASWLLFAIDVNELAFLDQTTGNPDETAINWIGFCATCLTSAKSQNLAMDAIDHINSGKGLTWTGAGGTLQSFIDFDEGTFGNRYGIISTKENIIYCIATLTIGSAVATTFSDSSKVVVWPWHRVGTGALGMYIDLQNAGNEVTFTTCTFKGNGKKAIKQFFDTTSLCVSDANDTVTFTEAHGLESGDYVLYSREGGADNIGLADATSYYVNAASTTAISFHTTRANAISGAAKTALTAQGAPGENNSVVRDPDNRIDITVNDTDGTLDFDSCILDGIRVLTLTSAVIITSGFIQNIGKITASSAVLTGVTVNVPTLTEGAALFDAYTADMSTIDNCVFNASGEGHLFRITDDTNSPFTSNSEYNGYWNPSANGWNFHTQTGVDPAADRITTDAPHGFTTGDAVYYNDEGGGDNVGLTDGGKYYVRVIDATTVSLHVTRAAANDNSSLVALSDGAAGETHSLYSSKATIFNDSGAAITINCNTGTDSPSIRNGTGASTTVTNSVDLNVYVIDENNDPVFDAQVAIYDSTDPNPLNWIELMNEDTADDGNGNALATTSYNYLGDTPIRVRIRKSSAAATRYFPIDTSGTIEANGFTLTAVLIEDTIAT